MSELKPNTQISPAGPRKNQLYTSAIISDSPTMIQHSQYRTSPGIQNLHNTYKILVPCEYTQKVLGLQN